MSAVLFSIRQALLANTFIACTLFQENPTEMTNDTSLVEDSGLVCGDSDCGPVPGLPNYMCEDGVTVAGPTGECEIQENDECGWTIVRCPEEE